MVERAPATSLPQKNKLLRILGLGFGLAVVVGGTIGVSIFRLPGPTANLLGNTWLILVIWTLGGAFTLLNANYTAELATMKIGRASCRERAEIELVVAVL